MEHQKPVIQSQQSQSGRHIENYVKKPNSPYTSKPLNSFQFCCLSPTSTHSNSSTGEPIGQMTTASPKNGFYVHKHHEIKTPTCACLYVQVSGCVSVREIKRQRETWGQCPTLGRTTKSSTESKFPQFLPSSMGSHGSLSPHAIKTGHCKEGKKKKKGGSFSSDHRTQMGPGRMAWIQVLPFKHIIGMKQLLSRLETTTWDKQDKWLRYNNSVQQPDLYLRQKFLRKRAT